MTSVAVILHGGGAAIGAPPLHPTDARAITAALALVDDVVVLEAVAAFGQQPRAVTVALQLGATRAVRIVDSALETADASATAFVVAAALRKSSIDLALCGDGADPEAVTDVPAALAHQLGARYLASVELLQRTDASALQATVRSRGAIHRLRVAPPAVLTISGAGAGAAGTAAATAAPAAPTASARGDGAQRAATPGHVASRIAVTTLADLGIDVALVRRRNNLRGTFESAPRALVTLTSPARLTALLRL